MASRAKRPAGRRGSSVLMASGLSAAIVAVGIWLAKEVWDKDVPNQLAASFSTIVIAVNEGAKKAWNLIEPRLRHMPKV